MTLSKRFWWLLAIAVACLVIGGALDQAQLVSLQMTYGDFDVPGKVSFVNRLWPGTPDLASLKTYRFVETHWHPLIALIGVLFPLMLIWGLWRNTEYWRHGITRVWTQWFAFVISRLGVFRAGAVYPIRRSCLGVFPFLNCQACEMTTGACPIGMFQNLLQRQILPVHLFGSMLLFGLILGKTICGWLCPFGFISDLIDKFSLHRWKIPRSLSHLRFWALGLVVAGPLIYLAAGIHDRNFFCSTICGSGKILGLMPYYLTTAWPAFSQPNGWPDAGLIIVAGQVALTLLMLVAMIFISGRVFCRILCPLGGFWGLCNHVSLAGIRHTGGRCQGCGSCETVCPMGVSREFSGFIDRTSCMTCGRCIPACRSGARSFRWGLPETTPVPKERVMEQSTVRNEVAEYGYGSLYNRLRRDAYLVLMPIIARDPLGMARYGFEQTRFYHRFYGKAPQAFDQLPLVTKQDIGSIDPYDLLSEEMRESVVLYGETTGSSGYPTPAFFTQREFQGARIVSQVTPYVGYLGKVLAENRAVVNGLTFGFTVAGFTFGDFLQHHGGMVANIGTRSTIATPERMARALKRLRPSVLTGTPIDLLCWARILQEDYPNDAPAVFEQLKVFLSTAELCSTSRSQAIRRHFNLLHVDIYACVEGFFSVPCPCGEKHILPIYHPEVFTPDLKCLGTFGEGRFAYTNLVKKSTPLVRYLLDDFVTVTPSRCPFGFTKSIEPHGRWELTVMIGERRLGVRHFEEAIFRHGLFGDYRVVLHDDRMEITVEEYGDHDAPKVMEERIGSEFGITTSVSIVPFGTITPYREVRRSKPILKVEDRRSRSTQKIPEYL